jgi:FkbH-like protein
MLNELKLKKQGARSMHAAELYWLPEPAAFSDLVAAAKAPGLSPAERFELLHSASRLRLDFVQTMQLHRCVARLGDAVSAPRLRVALIGDGTLQHIVPAIGVGILRRGLVADVHFGSYGQWRQEIISPSSPLHEFSPDVVIIWLSGENLAPGLPFGATRADMKAAVAARVSEIQGYWRKIRELSGSAIIQVLPLPLEPGAFGHAERTIASAPASGRRLAEAELSLAAEEAGVQIVDLAEAARHIGLDRIHDPALLHHAKQDISPAAAPWVGDQIARVAAALRGRSKKVLVLDLDNTLWGGVVGDDGLDGILLGQGSGAGEAFCAFQRYLKQLLARGVVLAVSSKNDLEVAEAVFRDHPEMILRRDDIAAFEANWADKPQALRRIAAQLNLGLDSFVFFDDNPAERQLMRQELPMVDTPEVPVAPELYSQCLADAGYFEAVALTPEDTRRAEQYAANAKRQGIESAATDLPSFLRDLQMTLSAGPFVEIDIPRITQLINKTNQFNLTTRRFSEDQVRALMKDPGALTLSARVADRFGDNGLICVIIATLDRDVLDIHTWLMSCRVLGRSVENALLALVAERASGLGARFIRGHYIDSGRNGIVRGMYESFGFRRIDEGSKGETVWWLDLREMKPELPPYFNVNTRSGEV